MYHHLGNEQCCDLMTALFPPSSKMERLLVHEDTLCLTTTVVF